MFILNLWEKVIDFLRMIKHFVVDQVVLIKNYFCNKKNHNNKNYEIAGAKVLKDEEKSNVQIYLDKIFYAIHDKNINNVALSGGYGTGKSSIAKTFIDNHSYKKKKYVVISIGSFLEYKIKESNDNNKEEKTDQIIDINELHVVDKVEESILKQLMHLNNYDDMPESNLKRIKSRKQKLFISLLIMFLFVNIFSYFILDKFSNFYDYLLLLYHNCDLLKWQYNFISSHSVWYLCISFLLFLIFVYTIIEKIISNNLVKIIKTEVASIEIKGVEDLTFNRKLFEILYIIKQNRIEAIFFEDIDRFTKDVTLMVMEELKELNTIINNSKVIKQDVTFIYEFKDDIFEKYTDRSKFYDYIISVMPLSTSSNSVYLLDGLVKNEGIDLDLVRIVSNNITDYRTLVNIVNDYKLFKDILILEENEKNYLFATMAYKNTEIVEYNDVCSGKNVLDELIQSINFDINEYKTRLDELIVDCHSVFADEEKIVKNKRELFYFLVNNFFEVNENGNLIDANNGDEILVKDLEDNLQVLLLSRSNYKQVAGVEEKILKLERMLPLVYDYNFYGLLDSCNKAAYYLENRPKMFSSELYHIFEPLKQGISDLVFDLILFGYLNENYLDYISLPVENSTLSRNDYRYILRVSHGFGAESIKLEHPESIIKFLDLKQCNNLRNFSLFDYFFSLSENKRWTSFFLEMFLEFSELTNSKLDFIFEYISNCEENTKEFLYILIKKYKLMYSLENYCNISKINKKEIFIIISKILEINDLCSEKTNYDFLTKFISENCDALLTFDLNSKEVVNNLLDLKIRFVNVSTLNDYLKRFVYDKRLYSFSIENIKSFDVNFDDKDSDFINCIFENIELFYKECYAANPNFKINSELFTDKIISSNVKDKIKRSIAAREGVDYSSSFKYDFKVTPKTLKLNPDWRSIKSFYEQDNSYSTRRLAQYVIKNGNILFNDNVLIRPIIDDDFIIELFEIMLKRKMLKEISMYLKALKKDKNARHGDKSYFNIKENYDAEVITFMINNRLVKYTSKNAEVILVHKEISSVNKGYFFEHIRSNKGYNSSFKLVQSDIEVLKYVFIYSSFDRKKDIIMHLKLSDKDLQSIYLSLLEGDGYFDFTKSEFNKIIMPNESMFEIKKVENIYRVKKK